MQKELHGNIKTWKNVIGLETLGLFPSLMAHGSLALVWVGLAWGNPSEDHCFPMAVSSWAHSESWSMQIFLGERALKSSTWGAAVHTNGAVSSQM